MDIDWYAHLLLELRLFEVTGNLSRRLSNCSGSSQPFKQTEEHDGDPASKDGEKL